VPVAPNWPETVQAYPGRIPAGATIRQTDVSNYVNSLYNLWWNNVGGPILGTLTNTVCHYSCHNNCHGNRGRR